MAERFEDVLSRRLKISMAEAGMSRKELSEVSGVSEDAIGKYLRGEMVPLLKTTVAIAEALNCTPNYLCGID